MNYKPSQNQWDARKAQMLRRSKMRIGYFDTLCEATMYGNSTKAFEALAKRLEITVPDDEHIPYETRLRLACLTVMFIVVTNSPEEFEDWQERFTIAAIKLGESAKP